MGKLEVKGLLVADKNNCNNFSLPFPALFSQMCCREDRMDGQGI